MKPNPQRLAAMMVALALCTAPIASAEQFTVKSADWCLLCPVGNVAINLEADGASVTLQALGLLFDDRDQVYRGRGTFEVRGIAFDPSATYIVKFQDVAAAGPCSPKQIATLIVHGQATGTGKHFTLIAMPENCRVNFAGQCPESNVTALLDTDADAQALRNLVAAVESVVAPKKSSAWGRVRIRSH